jgi:hypothetical protein
MLKKQKKTITTSLLITTIFGVFLSFPKPYAPLQVAATDLNFVITPSNFSTFTNNGNQFTGSITVSDVQVDLGIKFAVAGTGSPANFSLDKEKGVIYNISPLPGTIKSMTVTQKTGQSNTLYVGNTGRIISSVANDSTPTNFLSPTVTVSSTSQSFTSANYALLGSYTDLRYFAIQSSGGTSSQIESLTFNMTVNDVIVTNYKVFNFASDFLIATDNKQGLCTAADLGWTDLTTLWNSLNETEQNLFRTSTAEHTIIAARNRYIYLRSFNSSLPNFASI